MVNLAGPKHSLYRAWMDFVYWRSQITKAFSFDKHSYSAAKEDIFLSSLFPEKVGSYLDIGAGHPVSGSNTYLFYKRGWKGITIDPLKAMNLLHRFLRPRDIAIQAVISKEKGEVVLFEYNPTEYSTISVNHNEELRSQGFMPRRSYKVKSVELKSIIPSVSPKDPFFLSLDVEGSDLMVLNQLKELTARPRVVCVEQLTDVDEIKMLLSQLGYRHLKSIGNNIIYIHKEFRDS
jgi:FkbM family methyltransferase